MMCLCILEERIDSTASILLNHARTGLTVTYLVGWKDARYSRKMVGG